MLVYYSNRRAKAFRLSRQEFKSQLHHWLTLFLDVNMKQTTAPCLKVCLMIKYNNHGSNAYVPEVIVLSKGALPRLAIVEDPHGRLACRSQLPASQTYLFSFVTSS